MNEDELPPLGENDDDSRWSVEHRRDAAGGNFGKDSFGEDSSDSESGVNSGGGDEPHDECGSSPDLPGDEGGDPDPPSPDWSTAHPDETVVRRRHGRGRKRPSRRPTGKGEHVWRETLQVELPPTLNFLSLGIGFAMGCGFCFCLMALGYLPGSRVVREPRLPPVQQPRQAVDRVGEERDTLVEPPRTEVDQRGSESETPAEPPEDGSGSSK
jgi:hypothetical protein